jgi:hypothetical protein
MEETPMPEGPEVETEKLEETIKEELDRDGGAFLKQIAITTAILAVLAAIASLQAGSTVNAALVLKTEAVSLQSEASDQWTFYQAKGIKAAIQEASSNPWLAIGKAPPSQYKETMKRYSEEQAIIQNKALEKEHQRDERLKESDHLLHKHHSFASSVALLQVAIALGAVAALTRFRLIWFGSMLVGGTGIIISALTMFG